MRLVWSSLVPVAPPNAVSAPPASRRPRATRRRAGALRVVPATVIAVLASGAAAVAQDRVVLEIGTVLATNAGSHVDAQLASMQSQLERLFHYSSYQLVKQEVSDVRCGKPASFEIPGGRRLRVMPKTADGGRVALNVALLKQSHVLMNTDLTLGDRGLIMVGGPRYENGVLIIWIGARRPGDASPSPLAVHEEATGGAE